jgi:hypothetical protein
MTSNLPEDFIMENNDNKKHTSTRTTMRLTAGMPSYSCGFFCQRRTTLDEVIDPKKTSEKSASQPTVSHK